MGSNVAGDAELGVMTFLYEDLPGIKSKLIDRAELVQRMRSLVTVQDTTGALTSVTWSGTG